MTTIEKMMQRVVVSDGCWLWSGPQAGKGYGVMSISKHRLVYVHRLAYETANGPVPEGLEIDHLCNTRLCVRLDHLEAVTHVENVRRANERRTHCKSGHEFSPANTYVWKDGSRKCRACDRDRARAAWNRKKAA